jgi:hypothetical protein
MSPVEVKMTEETTSIETQVRDAAANAGVEQSTVDKALAESKSFLNSAKEALTEAVDNAVGAVKEHPVAAAGIAAGAAAAVAGAAYGASKLINSESKPTTRSTRSTSSKKKS